MFKIIILLMIVATLASLFMGLYFLNKDAGKTNSRTVKALSWRIGLSIVVFLLLIIGFSTKLITPHGLPKVDAKTNTEKQNPNNHR